MDFHSCAIGDMEVTVDHLLAVLRRRLGDFGNRGGLRLFQTGILRRNESSAVIVHDVILPVEHGRHVVHFSWKKIEK